MNSAYMSRLCRTSSSRRTWRVEVFGCFDGAFSSAKCFSSFRYSPCITSRITICILRILHAGKTRSRFLRDGLERPHELLGGWTAKKWGRSSPLRSFALVQNQRPRETQPQCSVKLPFTEKVNGTVNRSVNRIFHAPFTFPRQERPPTLPPD